MTTPSITMIAAVAADGGIGKGPNLLFRISADMRRFKQLTMGHPIIMGRKTYESFPNGPLPGRKNIVITRNANYRPHPDVVVVSSVELAMEAAGSDSEPMVIGGGEIYRQFMPLASRLEITRIHADSPQGTDVYFPDINPKVWHLETESPIETDEKLSVEYSFQTYRSIL
ncbi:MAG: dihydrofolate reductase [Muribaculum sp.]|nr:dihydrofolate reductase [Muribaculaceae bacterium]MCM1081486.1 dihydrofolate reductase [Muribaculum sp.]MCM1140377.1 dihydrofolate reductase [Muribaculum sp.]MCM1505340.1 dihydrofolate reductase [Muribaculum sp.]